MTSWKNIASAISVQALYANVLVAETHRLRPDQCNLTGRTRAFFDFLFPRQRLQQT